MAETGVKKFETAQNLFVGQGDLIIFDEIADSATATYAGLTGPKSLGQIVQDSTSWSGDDPETTTIKDEQGNLVTAKVAAGTLAFEFDIASTSKEMVKKFLNGVEITSLGTNANFDGSVSAIGFGVELPIITVPILISNDAENRAWFYPKAKIVSTLTLSDGLWRIHASATAEYLDTPTLKTAMLLEGKLKYDTTTV